jgi:FlaA1/EpsC-like NDP-sugar epimerase
MTITEAVQLVIQAAGLSSSGEVFLLDMGEPVKIMDLAKRMIELSGLTIKTEDEPFGDIEIQITGLRPGEKLFEELLIGNDPQRTEHPRIIKASESFIDQSTFFALLNVIEQHLLHSNDMNELRRLVSEACTRV